MIPVRTRKPRLPVRIVQLRKKLCNEAWQKYKNEFTMQEIAMAFRMSVSQFYEIVKGYAKKTE